MSKMGDEIEMNLKVGDEIELNLKREDTSSSKRLTNDFSEFG